MQSAQHGIAASTTIKTISAGLHYIGSNDTIYNEPLTPAQQTTISDLVLRNGTSMGSGVTAQLEENCDNMEHFMILTASQTIAITVLAVTICTFTVLENFMVLCVILHSHTLRSRPSYYFIGSLAMADLISSIIFVYSFLDFHVFHRKDCLNVFLFKLGGVNAAFTASVGSLFLTAIDRLICLHRPMAYKHTVTKAKAVIAFIIMWSISIVISLLPLLGWNCKRLDSVCSGIYPFTDHKYQMFWISMISVLFLFIIYAYVSILWKAHQHTVHMRFVQRNVVVSVTGTSVQLVRPEQTRMDLRLAKTLVLLLAALVICWGPVLTIMVYDLFWEVNNFTKTVFAFCTMLCLLNSTVNPVIYAMRSKELRRAFFNMCKVWRGTGLPLDNTGDSNSNYHNMAMATIGPACTAGEDTNGKTTETTEEPV